MSGNTSKTSEGTIVVSTDRSRLPSTATGRLASPA